MLEVFVRPVQAVGIQPVAHHHHRHLHQGVDVSDDRDAAAAAGEDGCRPPPFLIGPRGRLHLRQGEVDQRRLAGRQQVDTRRVTVGGASDSMYAFSFS